MVESRASYYYEIGEHVDCLDTCQKWCDATIIISEQEQVAINFTGYTSKYDEVIPLASKRI